MLQRSVVNILLHFFHYTYNRMKEQNQSPNDRFTIERFSHKGPFYLQPHQRVATLQNKVTFYEGQLDPLHSENTLIKQNHISLSRIVSISTDILRNLLPVGNSPAKKLKLQMANIDQIAKMIEQDWREMEQTISFLLTEKKQLEEEVGEWKQKLSLEKERRQKEVKQLQDSKLLLKNQYQAQFQNLQKQAAKAKDELDQLRLKAEQEQALRDRLIDSINRELQLQRRQAACKENDYERCIARLKAQMDNNLHQFQDAKKMIKQICEKLMTDKLNEQAEGYELMIKMKEDEKMMLQMALNDLTEETNQKMRQKDQEIQTLNLKNQSRAADLRRLQDQIYLKKEQLMRQIKNNKDLQVEMLRMTEKNQILSHTILKHQFSIQQHKQKIKSTIEAYEKDLKMIKQKGSSAINELLKQKRHLQEKINKKDEELAYIKASLQVVQEQWREKIQAAKREWLQKESSYTAQIDKSIKKLQEEKEKSKKMRQEKDKQIESLSKQHIQMIKRLQKQFQQNKQAYVREQTIKFRKLMDENEEQITKIKQKHKSQIELEKIKNQEEMRKQALEFQQRIAQNEIKFKQQRKKYEEQLHQAKLQEKILNDRLARAYEQVIQHQSQMQRMKVQQIKALKKLQLENEMNNKKWQGIMQEQMQSFLKQLQLKDSKIVNLQQQFNQQRQEYEQKLSKKDAELVSMKQHMQRQIGALKETNGMAELEAKHKSELENLQRTLNDKLVQIQQSYKRKISSLIEQHQRQTRSLSQNQDQKIAKMYNSFQKALVTLAAEIQKKSTFFNENFLAEQVQRKLEAFNQEQKISFIRDKMEENAKLIIEKDNLIANMQNQLQIYEQKFQQEMIRRRKELQIQKNNVINECNKKMANKEEECRSRVETVEKERKAFSEQLFHEFNSMKENHTREYLTLQKKYKELEELFSVRPSRAQDVTKIKQLISIQTRLDQEITIYHKKMETANEIVKYLNLQLENYKETYDIFGPTDATLNNNKTISFHDESHKMTDFYKMRELDRLKEERHIVHYDRKNSQSPEIKDLRIFPEKDEEKSESLIIESKEVMNRSRKYSLIPQRLAPPRDRLKTEKLIDRQSELMGHAETFMKLIKKTSQDVSIIKELESNQEIKKKTYRRRKLKRLATGVAEHYF